MAIRAPRTRIPDVYRSLQEANAVAAERERQAKQNRGRLLGSAGAAAIAAVTGLPLPAVMAAANVGGQVGGAARGAPLDPLALAQAGFGVVSALDAAAQQDTERNLLREIAGPPAARLRPDQVPAEGPIPGLGTPLPESAKPDVTQRMLMAAQKSPMPLATAAKGLQVIQATRPPKRNLTSVAPGGTLVDDQGVPVFKAPATPEKPEKGSVQVWVNKAPKGENPVWQTGTIRKQDLERMSDDAGFGNLLLHDPTKGDKDGGDPNNFGLDKTELGRAWIFTTDQQILEGRLPPEKRREFLDFLVRDWLARPEQTASGGRRPGTDVGAALEQFKKQPETAGGAAGASAQGQWQVVGRTSEGRPVVKNPDGGFSTELSITVDDPRQPGRFINIPSLYGGKPVSTGEALRRVRDAGWKDPETGRAVETYSSIKDAEAAAQARTQALQNDPGFKSASGAGLTAQVQQPSATPLVPVPSRAQEKPFTPEQSTKIQTLRQGLQVYQTVRSRLVQPDGSIDRTLVATMNPPVGEGVPWTEGRQRRQELLDALEARIRAESGAAVPQEEIERLKTRFLPSMLDSDAAIISKLDRAQQFFDGTLDLIEFGRGALSPETIAAIKANRPADWDQIAGAIREQQQETGGKQRLYKKYNLER